MKHSAKHFCDSIDLDEELFRAYYVEPDESTEADQELENAGKSSPLLYQLTDF